MNLETDLDDFSALSLLLQHRALVRGLDLIESTIEACHGAELPSVETALELLPLVRSFTVALPAHFAAESKSTSALLQSSADKAFSDRLAELDSEHPQLLAYFEVSVERLIGHGGSPDDPEALTFEEVLADLRTAIATFRRHEAEEDALFVE
jgi:hypothetical protein